MKTKIKVTYVGKLDKKLDSLIKRNLMATGFKWYAQGKNIVTDMREICFYKERL
jgi:hypothetical protein